jgi:hypothetical protein
MRRAVVAVLIIAIAAIGVAVGFGVLDRPTSHGAQIAELLTRVSDGRAAEVYEAASPWFRKVTVRDRFLTMASQLQATLGRFRNLGAAEEVTTAGRDGTGETARVSAAMVFENGKTRGEVSLIRDGDAWRLLGLQVDIPPPLQAKAEALRTSFEQMRAPPAVIAMVTQVLQRVAAGEAAAVHAAASPTFREAVDAARFQRLVTGQREVLGKFVRVMETISSSQNMARTRARVDALLEFERGMTLGRFEFVRIPAGARHDKPDAPETDWQLSYFKIVIPEPVVPH